MEVFVYTLKTAFLSTLVASIIGVGAAYYTSHKKFAGRKFLLSLSAVPLCVPPLIVALGYVSFFGINGTVNTALNTSLTFLYSTTGLVLAQGFYNFPLVTGIVHDAWEQLPKENENAARLLGAGEGRIFFTITLRQLSGAIGAACIPVFLFCFFSFMIVLLFSPVGKSTLEVEIYHSIRTTLETSSAVKLAVIETIAALLFVVLYGFVSKKSQIYTPGIFFPERKKSSIKKGPEVVGFIILALLILLFFMGPAFSIAISSFTKKAGGQRIFSFYNFSTLFSSKKFLAALKNSLTVAVVTSILCSVVAFLYAYLVRVFKKQGKLIFSVIPFIPMAISSVVISWVFSLIFHNTSASLLVFLELLLYWPIAYRQIQNGINQILPETENAARLLSKNKFDMLLRLYLPSCKKVLRSAFFYCFAVSLGDASLPLVLSIRDFPTLALYTYNLAGSYKFNTACACGLILTILCILTNRFRKTR